MRPGAMTFAFVLACALPLAGCGDDAPTKADFVDAVRQNTDGIGADVAGCVYAEIRSDARLTKVAMTQKQLSKADTETMQSIYADCLLKLHPRTTTTAPK